MGLTLLGKLGLSVSIAVYLLCVNQQKDEAAPYWDTVAQPVSRRTGKIPIQPGEGFSGKLGTS